MPGAPDGQYVVIQFETSFQNKKSAIKTVTPMFEKMAGGKYQVIILNRLLAMFEDGIYLTVRSEQWEH